MTFHQPDPLRPPLEEAKVATRAGAPVIISRQPDAALIEEAMHVVNGEAGFLEWKNGFNIRFGGDVGGAILVGADADIHYHLVVAHIFLERLDLEHPGTPAHVRG